MDHLLQTAEALLAQGEQCLLQRDLLGIELFQKASELDPSNAQLFLRQGFALFEYASEEGKEKILLLACKKLKAAAQLDPDSFAVWHLWGSILAELGRITDRHHYFLGAKEKLIKAMALSDGQSTDLMTDLYWDLGLVWKNIAEHSGEALDLQLAVDAFGKASALCDQLPVDFWSDYGRSCLDLAWSINDIRLNVKAINCFKHCVSTTGATYEGWMSLAEALEKLYAYTHDEDHFTQANECYSSAAQMHLQDDVTLWLNWARFLCEAGRRHQDIKRLRSCVEKCNRALTHDPENPHVIGIWSEALALIGELTERLDLIYEAQNKISESCQNYSDPDVWFSYGMCMNSFARYFNDIDYYYQAIEKFQEGVSIDRTCHRHWHAIANAFAVIGNLDGDRDYLEKACRFYGKAIDLHISSFYIYDYALTLSKLGEITQKQHWLEESVLQFERALSMQKNAIYQHPEWLFNYASTLDLLGDFYEDKSYYSRAIEIFSHVLMIDPDFPGIHYRMALAYAHLGDLLEENDHFQRSIHHYRLALKHEEENDQILLDWSITILNLAQSLQDTAEIDQYYREAEHKLTQSAKLGNINAYYHLACLFSLTGNNEKAITFIEKSDAFNALPPLEDILDDDWLEGLRSSPDFRVFLTRLEKRPNLHEER